MSRVDTEVDRRIDAKDGALATLRGSVATAKARLVYAAFLDITRSSRWRSLAAHGAKLQGPLWASTGTKNPGYSDVRYSQELIGFGTITTVPPETLRLFEDHGVVERTLPGDIEGARRTMRGVASARIDRRIRRRMNTAGEIEQKKSLAIRRVRAVHRPATSSLEAIPHVLTNVQWHPEASLCESHRTCA